MIITRISGSTVWGVFASPFFDLASEAIELRLHEVITSDGEPVGPPRYLKTITISNKQKVDPATGEILRPTESGEMPEGAAPAVSHFLAKQVDQAASIYQVVQQAVEGFLIANSFVVPVQTETQTEANGEQ